tara:strand:+ start:2495 stop:2695 length:201 start_codon:yes stop_codon:yes gene_type:complete
MKYKAQSNILKKGEDSISFSVQKRKKVAHIRYYYVYDGHKEDVICSLSDADERYENAIKAGYKVAF